MLRCAVENAPVQIHSGVAVVVCRTETLARVAERKGFRRVSHPAWTPTPTPAPAPAPAPAPTPAPTPVEEVVPAEPAQAHPVEAVIESVLDGSVDDLVQALAGGEFDSHLARVYVAERSGKNRKTALRSVITRSREIGVSFDVP